MESVRAPRDKGREIRPTQLADASSSGKGQPMARGWPSWAVGLALFALVLVILGGAFILDAPLKPKVGTEPVPTTVPSLAPTVAPTAAPSPGATIGGAVASSTVAPNAEKTAVDQAYLRYWDVYTAALYSLDTSHLGEVMAGDELDQARQTIEGLRRDGHAAKIDVEHHFAIIDLTDSTATIQDEYLNTSYLVNAETKQPVGTPTSGEKQTISCQLRLLDGTWKVVKVVTINETITQR